MQKVAFIGMGIMGCPMAARLKEHGYQVTGFSRSEASRARASKYEIEVADSAHKAVRGADVVITMLPDSPDVESVLTGSGGIMGQLSPGTDVIDMSTIRPDVAKRLAQELEQAGHGMLDAPVSGGDVGAQQGTLSIMVGGTEQLFTKWNDLLLAMGSSVQHVGSSGAGQQVKAANQLVVAAHLQALAEAVVLLEKSGANVPVALDVISKGLGGSTVIDRKKDSVLADHFDPGFKLSLHLKDLGIVANSSHELGVSLPLAAVVTQLVRSLVARGDGELDHSALVKLAREMNGSV